MRCQDLPSWNIDTPKLKIFDGPFWVFQRFSSDSLALRTVETRFAALDYLANRSIDWRWGFLCICMYAWDHDSLTWWFDTSAVSPSNILFFSRFEAPAVQNTSSWIHTLWYSESSWECGLMRSYLYGCVCFFFWSFFWSFFFRSFWIGIWSKVSENISLPCHAASSCVKIIINIAAAMIGSQTASQEKDDRSYDQCIACFRIPQIVSKPCCSSI